MDTTTRFSLTGLLTYVLLFVITVWTWLAAIPRLSLRLILRVLDVFESTMLMVVWEYQGDNILKFLYQHHYIQSGAAVVCAHPVTALQQRSKSQSTQTDDSLDAVLARQQILALDKLVNDLMPGLLCALSELPQRGALDCQLVRHTCEQNQSSPLVSIEPELQPQSACSSGELDAIEAGLQILVDKIGIVDTRLSQLQHAISDTPLAITASRAGGHDDRLAAVVDSLNAVKAKCEIDRMLALQLVQSLSVLDTTLASIDLSPCETARQVADAIVQTDDPTRDVSRNDSVFTELAETQVATPIHTSTEQPEMLYSSSSSISTDDDAAAADEDSAGDAEASTSDSDQCSVRSLKSLQMYNNSEKMLVGTSDIMPGNITRDLPFTAQPIVPIESGKSEAPPPIKIYKGYSDVSALSSVSVRTMQL
ncbi:hypothetical protein GGI03_004128 [Coemansia sp. RSA 2337]|nr:hypothetical protein GGI03_004128 [Coemansia sp. RSA 2337]